MDIAWALAGDGFWWHEEAPEAEGQAAVEFLRGFVHVVPVDGGDGDYAVRDGLEELRLPGVVGAAVGRSEIDVVFREGEDADGGEQDAAVHTPAIEQLGPFVGVVARRWAAVDVAMRFGEEPAAVDVGAAQAGEDAFEHDFLADDELLDAVGFFDSDGAVSVGGFEIALPQVGGLHDVGVAVDDGGPGLCWSFASPLLRWRGLPPTEKRRGRLFSTPPQGGSDTRSEGLGYGHHSPLGGSRRSRQASSVGSRRRRCTWPGFPLMSAPSAGCRWFSVGSW